MDLDFEAARDAADRGEALILDLDGYEGPLHLLLELARSQKVDLLKLSVSKLVDQYLAFLAEARARRFAVAADYLVMAAWLIYLKSRLLLPRAAATSTDEASAEDMAEELAFRLAKLAAMREAAENLLAGSLLRRDVFPRGDPEAIRIAPSAPVAGDLYELMRAYIDQRKRTSAARYTPKPPQAFPLEEARSRLRSLLSELERWTPLTGVAPLEQGGVGPTRASFIASTLSASLELVREGELEARQLQEFAEIYLRARRAA